MLGKGNCHFSSVILCLCICLSDADAANLHGIKETNGTKQLCDSKVSGTAQGKISKPTCFNLHGSFIDFC